MVRSIVWSRTQRIRIRIHGVGQKKKSVEIILKRPSHVQLLWDTLLLTPWHPVQQQPSLDQLPSPPRSPPVSHHPFHAMVIEHRYSKSIERGSFWVWKKFRIGQGKNGTNGRWLNALLNLQWDLWVSMVLANLCRSLGSFVRLSGNGKAN